MAVVLQTSATPAVLPPVPRRTARFRVKRLLRPWHANPARWLLVAALVMAAGAKTSAQTQQMYTVDTSVGTTYSVTADGAGNVFFPAGSYIGETPAGTAGFSYLSVSGSGGLYPFSSPIVAVASDISGDLFVAVQYPLNSPTSGPYVNVYELKKVPIAFTGNTTSNSTLISLVSSTTGLAPQQLITGPGIPPGTRINSVSGGIGGSVYLTLAATATATGVTLQATTYTWGGLVYGPSSPPLLSNNFGYSTLNSMAYDNLNGLLYVNFINGNDGGQNLTCAPISILFQGATTSGSATISSLSTTSGLIVGQLITGPGLPPNDTILSIGPTSITLSAPLTATQPSTTTFGVASTVTCNTINEYTGQLAGNYANGLAVDGAGNVYTTITNSISSGYVIQFPAGLTGNGKVYSTAYSGGFGTFGVVGGNPAVVGLAADDAGQVFVDYGPQVLAYIPSFSSGGVPNGFFTPVAGTGINGYNGDGTAPLHQISGSEGVGLDPSGNMWIADTINGLIRQVASVGIGQGEGTGGISGSSFGCIQCGPQTLGNGTGGGGGGGHSAPSDTIPTNHFTNLSLLNPATHKLYLAYPTGLAVFNTANDTVQTTSGAVDFIPQNITQMVLDSKRGIIWAVNSSGQVLEINSATDQIIGSPITVATGAQALDIAVDRTLNQVYVGYGVTSGIFVTYHVALLSGSTGTVGPTLSLNGPPQAIVADSARGLAYVLAQDPYNGCSGACAQYNYDMVVINGTTANGGRAVGITTTTTLIRGSAYSSGITQSSLAVDPNTGKVVLADGVDSYATIYIYNSTTPSSSTYNPVGLGWVPNAVTIDTANSIAYVTDSQYNNVREFGLAAVLPNTTYAFTTTLFSGTQGGNSCGFLGNAVAPDPTTGEVYITTCAITPTINFTGATVAGGNTVTVSSTTGLIAGQIISGGGGAIPSGDTIASVGTGQITLTQAATLSASNASFYIPTFATPQLNLVQYNGYSISGSTLTPSFTTLDSVNLPLSSTQSYGAFSYGYALNVDTSDHAVFVSNGEALNILVFNGPHPVPARPQIVLGNFLAYNPTGVFTQRLQTLVVTNNGAGSMLAPQFLISGTNQADYTLSSNGCSAGVAPAAQCNDVLSFIPSILGSDSATGLVIDDSPDVPQSIPLSGTGVLPSGLGTTPSTTLFQVSPSLLVAPGASLSLYATISPSIPSSGEQVLFLNNNTSPATVLGNGVAQGGSVWKFTTTSLAAGTYSLTAYYAGDSTYASSTSQSLTVAISTTGSQPSQPQLSFTPGEFYVSNSQTGTTNFSAVALDAAGDEFVLDSGVGSVTEYPISGSKTAYVVSPAYDQGSPVTHPSGIAVAPNGGTVYIADTQNGVIGQATSAGTSFLTPLSIASGCSGGYGPPAGTITLSKPTSVSIGPPATPATVPNGSTIVPNTAGYDLYVADSGNQRVLQINPTGQASSVCGYYIGGVLDGILAGTDSPTGPALNFPLSVAATGTIGNTTVYIADAPKAITNTSQGNGTIYKNGTAIANTGQIIFPYSLATDAAGDLYYSDQSLSQIWRVDTSNNFLLEAGNGVNSVGPSCTSPAPCEATQTNLLTPYGLGISGNGSIFAGDTVATGQVGEVNVTTGLVNFPSQPTSTPSAPVTVTVTDTASMQVGASAADIAGANPTDFAIVPGGSCNTAAPGFTLQPGKSCTILVTFNPGATGTRSGEIDLTVQGEIYGGSVQKILLTGNGVPATGPTPQTITFPPPVRPVVYGSGSATLSATASSGLPVSYSLSGPGGLSGNTVNFSGVGTVRITASQAGNGSYAAATSIEQDIQVVPATLSVTTPPSTRVFEGPDPGFPVSITGFVPPDSAATILTGSPTFTVMSDLGNAPASSVLTVKTNQGSLVLTSPNYSLSLLPSTLTIVCCEIQTLQPGSLPPANFPLPVGHPFSLTVASLLPVTYSIVSGPGVIGTNSLGGSTLTATSTGLITVQVTQTSNNNISAGPPFNLTFVGQ